MAAASVPEAAPATTPAGSAIQAAAQSGTAPLWVLLADGGDIVREREGGGERDCCRRSKGTPAVGSGTSARLGKGSGSCCVRLLGERKRRPSL